MFPPVAHLARDEGGGQAGGAEVPVPLEQLALTLSRNTHGLQQEKQERRENMDDHSGPDEFLRLMGLLLLNSY